MNPYRVPFRFDRSKAPCYHLVNVGPERLRGVTVSLLGPGLMPASDPIVLEPRATMHITIRGDDLPRETAAVVRWLRPDGSEYLWRVSF